MEKQEVGLLRGLSHPWPHPSLQHPCKAETAALFYRWKRAQCGEVTCPGAQSKAEAEGFPGPLKPLPLNHIGRGRGSRGAWGGGVGSEQRGYRGNRSNGANGSHKVTQAK